MCQVVVPGRQRPHGARQTADSRRLPHRPRVGTPPAERRLLVPGVPCETVISGGLWSEARGRACPADRASFPGAPALCPGESRLSGRVGPPLLHPGSEDSHMPCLPAGLQACQLALSARTVWARCPNGDLARRFGVTDKNPAGDYWKRSPGSLACVTGRCWAPGPVGGAGPRGCSHQAGSPKRDLSQHHARGVPSAWTLPGSPRKTGHRPAHWKAKAAAVQVEGCLGPPLGSACRRGAPAGE